MEPHEEKCSVALVLAALVVLAINYGYLAVDALSFTAGAISITGVKSNGLLLPVTALGVLIGCGICHVRHHAYDIAYVFSAGYRESQGIVELVRTSVAAAAEDTKYGAPYGGLRGSLLSQSQNLGQFIKPNGGRSEPVIISPDRKTHISAVLSGLRRLLGRGFWLSIYAPLLLAIWALFSIAV